MESPIFFCFPFKGHICYRKGLKITRRSVEAIKKKHFYPRKKKCLKEKSKNGNPLNIHVKIVGH